MRAVFLYSIPISVSLTLKVKAITSTHLPLTSLGLSAKLLAHHVPCVNFQKLCFVLCSLKFYGYG